MNTLSISFQCGDPLDSYKDNPPIGQWHPAHFMRFSRDEELFYQVLPPATQIDGYHHEEDKKGKRFWRGKSEQQTQFESDPFHCISKRAQGDQRPRFLISTKEND